MRQAHLFFLLLAGIALAPAMPAWAQDDQGTQDDQSTQDDQAQPTQQSIEIGNKKLELVMTNGRTQAKVDGASVEEDAFIQLGASFSAGDTGAAVLLVSDGGNGCPGNYVVVSVDAKGKVAVTDPFGTCSDTAETSAAKGIITVRFAPSGGRDGTVYHWSFDTGLEQPVTEPFKPKAGTSWADAGDLIGRYPWEALDNADVYAAYRDLLGADFQTFTDYFGKGDQMGSTDDGIIVGECFDDSSEDSTELLIGIDPKSHKVYAAMQDGDEAPRLYPPQDQWPASLQAKLKQWPG
ncbi:MAG TPA: hypothetical protein VHE77_09145 [Dongiaceae bacterium]|jgi:hypothetical protein|nr:hypothetical protein [Dongiaceae bacterium]